MKNKNILLTIIFLVITIVTIFLLYKGCNNVEKGPSFTDSVKLFIDKDEDKTIYNFTIKNTANKPYDYNINLDSNDILNTNELDYDLVLDNDIIKSSTLGINNILDSGTILADSIKSYSLIIKSTEDIHFDYNLSIVENNN